MVDLVALTARHNQIFAFGCLDDVNAVGEAHPLLIRIEESPVLQLEVLALPDGFVDLVALQRERQLLR